MFVPLATTTKPAQKGTHYMHIELFKRKNREEALMLKEKPPRKLVFANYPFRIDYVLKYLFPRGT